MRTSINYVNTCYVLLQINKIHPIADVRHDLEWYPERAMTLIDCINYRPYVKSIVTENAWLISCYDRENVRIWNKKHGWIRPNDQTYGASVNSINMTILGIRNTIPSAPLDGGKAISELIEKLKEERPSR
jgi:hypothetical protein